MNSNLKNAKNFVFFLRKQKCIIPENFITKYYNLTKDNFVSLSDCIDWLDVTRNNILKTLRKTYNNNMDYFEIDYKNVTDLDDFEHLLMNKLQELYIKSDEYDLCLCLVEDDADLRFL